MKSQFKYRTMQQRVLLCLQDYNCRYFETQFLYLADFLHRNDLFVRFFILFVWRIYAVCCEAVGSNNNQLLNKMKGEKREKQIPIGELIKPSV